MSDDERQRWIDQAGKPIWEEWVATMEGKGHANARQILDETIRLSQQ